MRPEVAAEMLPWLTKGYGNPSSLHEEGRKAKDAIDEAREALSETLGCLFAEVVFTGSGTEAANLAILGTALQALADGNPRNRILLGAAEHHCVLHTAPMLQKLGFQVEFLGVDRGARIPEEILPLALGDDVLLVSVMHANNETGTLQPVSEVAAAAHRVGAIFHCDAVQTFLNLPGWSVDDLDADLLTVSAHKVNGPKGVGAVYMRAGVEIEPILFGGSQERELRPGTENVAGITGFGAAIRHHESEDRSEMRNAFVATLVNRAGAVPTVKGSTATLSGHAHVRFPGINAETLLIKLDRMGVAASAGAACSSGSLEPSHVLLACGYSPEEAAEGIRFSLGYGNTADEVAEAAGRVVEAVAQIRAITKRP